MGGYAVMVVSTDVPTVCLQYREWRLDGNYFFQYDFPIYELGQLLQFSIALGSNRK